MTRRIAGLAIFAAMLLACACSRSHQAEAPPAAAAAAPVSAAPPPSSSLPKVSPSDEFEAFCAESRESMNPYYGLWSLRALEEQAKSADPAEARAAHGPLGRAYLKAGDFDRAVTELERALAELDAEADPAARIALLRNLIGAHLKQGELANCIANHGPTSCIMPFAPEAVHRDHRGSEAAIRRIHEWLAIEPDNSKARWLLTFAHATLGTKAPAKFRIDLPPSEADIGRFPNVAPLVGLNLVNLAGGVVMDDFDADGLLDIVTTDCDPCNPMRLWRNQGDGRFEERVLPEQKGGLNLTHADYDSDGLPDLLVLRGGWLLEFGDMRVSLLRNRGGGVFEDVTRAVGLEAPDWPTQTAAWADYDRDGDLDVFIGSEGKPCRLFRNDVAAGGGAGSVAGGRRFTNIAREAGVENDGFTKGSAWGDFDNDGDPDLFVSNFTGPNRLYRNDAGGARFVDVAPELGVTEPLESFACWFFDQNNDGWLDLFVAGYNRDAGLVAADLRGLPNDGARPRLYLNRGGTFEDVTRAMGLWKVWQPMGASFGDLDNDGLLDIYLGTGFPEYDALVPNIMLRNAGERFQDITISGGFGHVQKGHGVAWADIDNDGDMDVFEQMGGFFPGDGARNALFRNPGHGRHWISVRLRGHASNASGVGARLRVRTATRTLHRVVVAGGSFGEGSFTQHVGLGGEVPLSVEIDWPVANGVTQVIENVPADAAIEIAEGEPGFVVIPRKIVKLGP